MRLVSEERTCVSTAWRGPGATSSSDARCRCGTAIGDTVDFRDGKQWLLRFFDQIRFYPVSAAELAQMREDFPYGRFRLEVQDSTLRLSDYRAFLQENAASIAQFKARQQAAFEAERERWNETASRETPGNAPDEAPGVG